jgi:hypothetical protein
MNLSELLVFVLALTLSILLGRYFFPYIGWWCVFPAAILGFGSVFSLLFAINRWLDRGRPGNMR